MGMNKSTFNYFSTKFYNYLKTEFAKVKKYLDNNSKDIKNTNDAVEESKQNIIKNTDDIKIVSDKIDDIQTKIDNGDFDKKEIINNINGNVLNLNNVKQYRFKNIKAGESIEIPNENGDTDFLIECYEQTDGDVPLIVREIEVNETTKDLFEYDERYVEFDENCAKPKDNVEIDLDLISSISGLNVYVSKETIPIELIESINNITNYEIREM